MKRILYSLLLVVSTSVSHGVTYSTGFDSTPPYPALLTDADLDNLDGWSVTDTSTGFLSFVTAVTPGAEPTTNFGGLGGLFDSPGAATVGVSRAYFAELRHIAYNVRISLLDSTNGFPNRDSFGISLLNGTSNVFSINLTPTVTNPADPDASGSDGIWDLSYTAGVGPSVTLNQAVIEGGYYDLALSFATSGMGTSFVLDTTGDDTKTRTGTISTDPTTGITAFGFTWSVTDVDPSNSGDNALLFDNITIVPEPSSCLILGIAGLGFVFRRVRG